MGARLRGLDDIFGASAVSDSGDSTRVVNLKLCDLDFFPQRTRMYPDDEALAFADDIKQNGVHEPILARPMPPDEAHPYAWYQVLNGRNRVKCSRIAGKEDIPAIVREADDAMAAYIVSTTTLNQRQRLSPSEKAFAYKMQLDAQNSQGKRTDLTLSPLETKLNSGNTIALVANESRANVFRFIRLTELIPPLLKMVDTGDIPIRAGMALSYLSTDEQEVVEAYLQERNIKLTVEQAENLKQYSQNMGEVSFVVLERIYHPEKSIKAVPPNQRSIKFSKPVLQQVWEHIPSDVEAADAPDYILRALEFYQGQSE